jgi:two-component system, chemotaxis family, protein-glutamate methylesterase/glutaminase
VSETPQGRLRVLVVDGDAVLRQGLSRFLGEAPGIEVVGWATTGRTAQPKIATYRPDLILVDLANLPVDGLELLQHLQQAGQSIRRVVLATAEVGSDVLGRAAALGAVDVVRRPSICSTEMQLVQLARDLAPVVLRTPGASGGRMAASVAATGGAAIAPQAAVPGPTVAHLSSCPVSPRRTPGGRAPLVVSIGVSTGGPKALAEVLPRITADFPLPIVIVQHMPPKFTASLAESLDRQCKLRVREAQQGDRLVRGQVLIAPGGKHMRIVKGDLGETVDLTEDAPVCSCRPSVDYLFQSLHQTYGGRVLGVILTGMGEDGWAGSQRLYDAGACLIAQDEASSTVYGMPRGPIQSGIATAVSLDNMADAIQLAARGNSCN